MKKCFSFIVMAIFIIAIVPTAVLAKEVVATGDSTSLLIPAALLIAATAGIMIIGSKNNKK